MRSIHLHISSLIFIDFQYLYQVAVIVGPYTQVFTRPEIGSDFLNFRDITKVASGSHQDPIGAI